MTYKSKEKEENQMNLTEFKIEMVRNNLNQLQLAKAMGLKQSNLSKKINGVTEFTREDIAKAIKVLNLSPDRTKEIFFN